MSRADVETVRRAYEYYMAVGEIPPGGHPDFVWDVSGLRWPGQQIYPGSEGATQFLAEWADAWDDWALEVEEYIDAGVYVVVILNQRGFAKATGVPVNMRFAQVWTMRDGQTIRMQMYANLDEAFEAVGLSE
jgi:ketosteroid isomerase-like protein